MSRAAVCMALLSLYSVAAFAQDNTCIPPPCKISPNGRAACEAAADWVLEGELGSVTDEWERTCPNCEPKTRWKGSTIILYKTKALKLAPDEIFKGTISTQPYGGTVIVSASPCWQAQTKIDLLAISNLVRFYGSDKTGPYPAEVKPGYFAYEVVRKLGGQN